MRGYNNAIRNHVAIPPYCKTETLAVQWGGSDLRLVTILGEKWLVELASRGATYSMYSKKAGTLDPKTVRIEERQQLAGAVSVSPAHPESISTSIVLYQAVIFAC